MTERPSPEEFARETKLALARTTLRYGQTLQVRRAAMREIDRLVALRSPAMRAWLELHPEAR